MGVTGGLAGCVGWVPVTLGEGFTEDTPPLPTTSVVADLGTLGVVVVLLRCFSGAWWGVLVFEADEGNPDGGGGGGVMSVKTGAVGADTDFAGGGGVAKAAVAPLGFAGW